MSSRNAGCLGFLFGLFGKEQQTTAAMPFRLRQDFLSRAELSFYHVLRTVAGESLVVMCKVGLKEIFYVAQQEQRQSHQNRIDRKHVDFLLCDARTLRPMAGLELDDASHNRPDRRQRDRLVEEVFETAGLPLVRVPVRQSYSVEEVRELLRLGLEMSPAPAPVAAAAAPGETPTCPRCGVPMLLRTAKKGQAGGSSFWGCSNYPKCRETQPLNPR